MKNALLIGLLSTVISQVSLAGNINLHRGNLLDTDKIDLDLRKQSGNCTAIYPAQSIDCSYETLNYKGLMASFIDKVSQQFALTTTNTYLLNVAVNGKPFASCQSLQAQMINHTLVTINTTGCVIS